MKEYARITLTLFYPPTDPIPSLFSYSRFCLMVQRFQFCEGFWKIQQKKKKWEKIVYICVKKKRRVYIYIYICIGKRDAYWITFLDINYMKVACMCNLFASFHNTAKNLNCKKELCGVEMVFERFHPSQNTQNACSRVFDTIYTLYFKLFDAVFIITIYLIIKKKKDRNGSNTFKLLCEKKHQQ